MRPTTDSRRYGRAVPGVMAALFLLAGVVTAGCGSEESSTALPAPGSDADVDGTVKQTATSRGGSRSTTTKSSSRTATTNPKAANGSTSGDKGGAPSKDGTAARGGTGPVAGNPSVTNAGPTTTGPGTTRPTTKATGGATESPGGKATRSGGAQSIPGPNADPSDTVVISGRGVGGGPSILPDERLLAHFNPLYEALPARSEEVMRQTENVVMVTREAAPGSPSAATGDAAILVAAAEEVHRTGNVAKYEEPQVRAAYQNLKAEQARSQQAPAPGG